MARRTRNFVWILLTIAVLALTTLSLLKLQPSTGFILSIVVGTLLVTWLGYNRTQIARNDSVTFVHTVSLFLGLTLGPYPAIISATFGLLLSLIAEQVLKKSESLLRRSRRTLLIGSRQLIALTGGMAIYLLLGGNLLYGAPSLPEAFPTIALAISFSLLFVSLHAVQRWLQDAQTITRRDSIIISLIALIPIPIVVIGTVAFSVFAETALIIYGATVAFAAPAFRALIETQTGLARKTRALSALFDLALASDFSTDVKSYNALIDLALSELGLADHAALFLQNETDHRHELVHAFNIPSDQMEMFENAGSMINADKFMTSPYGDVLSFIKDSELPAPLREFNRELAIEKTAALALRTDGDTIGHLLLFLRSTEAFSPDELDQVLLFSDQLSKTITLSREFAATNAELRRRVEQLARLEAIGRQVTASINIEDVYQTIIFHGIQATSAIRGHLELVVPESNQLELVAFESEDLDEIGAHDPSTQSIHQLAERAFETGQITNVADTRVEPEFEALDLPSQSLLITPIISKGETIGVITLSKNEPGGFSAEEEAFTIQLSSQAANALRNSMMYEELEQRLREQSLLYQASAQIAESLDTEAVSLALADSLAFTVNAKAAFIYRYSSRNDALQFITGIKGRTTLEAREIEQSLKLEMPGVKACIDNRQPIQWTASDAPTEIDAAHLAAREGGTILLLPLIVGERTLGLVELIRYQDTPFDAEQLRTAQSIAIQASIVLENSDLFQQISQSNNRLSAVLNSTREGMLMFDKDGKIAVVNTQLKDLLEIDPELLSETKSIGLDDEIIKKLGYKPKEIEELIDSLRSGEGHLPGISTYESSKDERQILRRLETPVHDSSGRLIGWLIVIRDVSEEMQLEESRKHLTEMIVHDLRSPLSAILNSMELFKMQFEGQEKSPIMQQALAIADRSVHQMLGLVNALLDLSKLESGQFVLASNETDFNELIPHLIDTFLPEAEQAGVILDYQIDPEITTITLDEEKIFRVLSNLIDNALKFTPAGGKVVLELKCVDDQLFIDVRDTGPGVPPEFREQIFNLYAQVPGTEGRRRGTGLGLAFCKLAVEAHDGEIWVEDNPGGGSRFRVRLQLDN